MNIFKEEDSDFQKKIIFWFSISLVIHLICPYFSFGYWYPDEHFQILEFLGNKLYGTPGEKLAWEYNARMRPWIQIWNYYWLVKPFKDANPFFLAFLIRLFTSLLAFVSTIFLTKTVFSFFKNQTQKHYFLIFLTIFWFIPFLHARCSSENFSAALFFIALYYFLKRTNLFFSGLLLGLSFMVRFHIGFFIFPLFVWAIVIGRYNIKQILFPILGLFIGISLGILADYYGYGEWVFTPWNFLAENILKDKVSNFGTSPFWGYIPQILINGGGPIGLILLLATFWGWKNYPKNPLTWITIPYFLVHSFIGHKEFRYLTPLFFLSIFYLTLWIQTPLDEFFQKKTTKALLVINMILFIYFTFAPARFGLGLKKTFYARSSEIGTLYTSTLSPYSKFETYDSFYKPKNLNIVENISFDEVSKLKKEFWFGSTLSDEIKVLFNKKECEFKFSSYPKFIMDLNFKKLWKNKSWAIFKCNV